MMVLFANTADRLFLACLCHMAIINSFKTGKTQAVMEHKLSSLINLHTDKAWTLVKSMNTIAQEAFCKAYLTLCGQTFHVRCDAIIPVYLLRI